MNRKKVSDEDLLGLILTKVTTEYPTHLLTYLFTLRHRIGDWGTDPLHFPSHNQYWNYTNKVPLTPPKPFHVEWTTTTTLLRLLFMMFRQ